MSDEEEGNIFIGNWMPIPEIFWSDLDHKPFEKCMVCERDLQQEGTMYLIEKAMKTYKGRNAKDTIFEYAICMPCRDEIHQQLSEDSRRKINAYFEERFDPKARVEQFGFSEDIDARLKNCLVRDTEATEGGEYQIFALCDGKDLILDALPYMLTGEAMDEIMQLLSNETLDQLNGFMDEHFTGPPEFKEILSGPRLVI